MADAHEGAAECDNEGLKNLIVVGSPTPFAVESNLRLLRDLASLRENLIQN